MPDRTLSNLKKRARPVFARLPQLAYPHNRDRGVRLTTGPPLLDLTHTQIWTPPINFLVNTPHYNSRTHFGINSTKPHTQ